MAIVDPITRDRLLSFMAKVAAFQKAKAANPDFEGLIKSIERLGRAELVDQSTGLLSSRHFSTVESLANRKVFGLSSEQQRAVCEHYWKGLNSDLGGRPFYRSIDPSVVLDPNNGDRIYALGRCHATRIRNLQERRFLPCAGTENLAARRRRPEATEYFGPSQHHSS